MCQIDPEVKLTYIYYNNTKISCLCICFSNTTVNEYIAFIRKDQILKLKYITLSISE